MEETRFLAGVAAVLLLSLGCGDDDDAGPPVEQATALIRVVHGSPDAPAVDVLFNGAVVLTNVPYLGASEYLTVPAGPANLQVRVTGTDVVAIEANADLAADTAYSVIAVNPVASIEPLVLVDNIEPPAAGQTRVRLIHGAPSAPDVDIYVTGADDPLTTPLLTGVPYLAVADDLTAAAGTYRVRIAPEGTQDVALDTGGLDLASGVAYTAIAVDAAGGGAPFGALLLVDRAP